MTDWVFPKEVCTDMLSVLLDRPSELGAFPYGSPPTRPMGEPMACPYDSLVDNRVGSAWKVLATIS